MQTARLFLGVVKTLWLSVMLALPLASNSQVIDPDRPVALTRIDPLTGKVAWSFKFPKALRPTRCEAYTNRIVVFLFDKEFVRTNEIGEISNDIDGTKIVFLDSRSGRSVDPSDTRTYNHSLGFYETPEIAASELGYVKQEISLPNGWHSYGVTRLHWIAQGSNLVHFFNQRLDLVWTLPLPPYVYHLSHWNDMLVHSESNPRYVTHLLGQKAGAASPTWEFVLPSDIPSQPFFGSDVFDDKVIYRNFSFTIGKNDVFISGNGWLFALNPNDGKIRWRHCVATDSRMSQLRRFDAAEIVEANGNLILVFGNAMTRFDIASMNTTAVIRNDLYDNGPTPIYFDGALYCFHWMR